MFGGQRDTSEGDETEVVGGEASLPLLTQGQDSEPGQGVNVPMTPGEFAARFEASRGVLWTVAAAVLGNASEADDVLQDAATIGLQKAAAGQAASDFVPWLVGIVRNVARNQLRQRRRRGALSVDPVHLDASHSDSRAPATGRSPEEREFDQRVLEALATLDATARECLLLRTVLEMSYRDIAAVLGIPVGTAMSHVFRARQRLRGLLSEEQRDVP